MSPENNLQIEMAARGCVSGTLEEWPALNIALVKFGLELPKETPASELKDLCSKIYTGELRWVRE